MSLTYRIRRLLPDDGAAYRELFLLGVRSEPESFSITEDTLTGMAAADMTSRLATRFVAAAELEGELVAFAGMREMEAYGQRVGHVGPVYVRPDYRRHGIARALMVFVEQEAVLSRAEHLQLLVSDANVPAVELYKGMGFAQVSVPVLMPRIPPHDPHHVWMVKDL